MKTYIRLLFLLKPLFGWVFLSALLGAGTVASGIGLLGTSAYLLSRAALHPSIAVLQVSIVGVRFFGISRGVMRYLERLVSHSVNLRLLSQLRARFYRDIEPLAPARLMVFHSGDLLARIIGDIDTLENFYLRAVAPPFVAIIITILMGLFVGQFNPIIGLILVFGLLLGGAGVPAIAYFGGRHAGKRIIMDRSRISSVLVDGIQGMRDLLINGQVSHQTNLVLQYSKSFSQAQRILGLGRGVTNATNLLVTNLTLWVVLCFSINLVNSNQLEGVLLPVVALIVLASFEAVNPLGTAAHYLQSSYEAAKRLFELSDIKPAVLEPVSPLPAPHKTGLKFSYLTFRYPFSLKPALKNINLDLPAGIHAALIGSNGSGKSTIVNLLQRFWDYDSGSIQINGVELKDISSYDIRRIISVKPQSIYLFCGTLRDNLLLAQSGVSDNFLVDVLHKALLDEWFNKLPEGLDTWIGEHGMKLSGGERQRLAIARTLLQDTPIVVFDEPTEHLDAGTEMTLVSRINHSLQDRTVLWISHRLTGLDQMDFIVILKEGLVIEQGHPDELLKSGGYYSKTVTLATQILS
jgi:ATP-binding cassette subfamily C protein CydC